ncbi:MAG: hypothetical protein IJA23_06355 [Clostridia bacterium]|nr:hypothetical protein [Clostridia bacterium]
MKFSPKAKGMKLGLYSDIGLEFSMPKGMNVRFDTVTGSGSFQFFVGKKPVTPIMISIENDQDARYIATLRTGERVPIDFEKQAIGKPFLDKIENTYIGLDCEIVFDVLTGKPEPYFLDKRRFKMAFENGYLLRSLIGVKNREGKCAIFDAYSKKLITDFVLDPDNYGLVGALNLETNTMFKSYYIVQTIPEEKETTDKTAKKFIIVGDDGQFVADFVSHKYLWNHTHEERQPDGSTKQFSYVAFAEKDANAEIKTRILKVDIESGKVEKMYQLPLIAIKSIKADKSFVETNDGRVVLITASPEKQASMGAYALNENGTVETLLDNVNTEIEYTGHYKKGRFLTYKNPETVGKIALDGKARTFEVKKAEFISLAKKYFGESNPSAIRPKLQKLEEQVAPSGKKKPTGGGPSGGDGPNGSGFGG